MKRTDAKPIWPAALLLFIITFIAYQPVWHAGFIWDDDHFLLNNALIHQPDGLRLFWFSTIAPDYFPMTSTTLWLEWRLWGENPLGYHLVNVFLHACSAVLWWRLLEKMKIPLSWLAAAHFALHPVNVESVAWITERKNTLSMFFYVSALLAYLKSKDAGGSKWYWLSVGMFLFALLSKTAPVMLPFVLLGIEWWRQNRRDEFQESHLSSSQTAEVPKKSGTPGTSERSGTPGTRPSENENSPIHLFSSSLWLRLAPFFLLSLALGLITVWFQYNRAISSDVVRLDSFSSRLAGAGWAIWFYFYKAVLPINLSFVYPKWQINSSNFASYVPALLVVAGFAVGWVYRRTWGRVWLAAFGYFVLMLLPVLGFLNIYFMRYSLVADHWQYFAIIGPIALFTAGLARMGATLQKYEAVFGRVVGGMLLLILGILTWRQTGMYRDVETLWRRTVATNPRSAMAQNALGYELLKQRRIGEALFHVEKSLAIQPNDPMVQYNFAMSLIHQGNPHGAVAFLEKCLAAAPLTGEAQNNLAWLLATCPTGSVRNGTKAVELALEADRLSKSNNPMFMETLAAAYAEAGRFPEAIATAQKALELANQKKAISLAEVLRMRIELYQAGAPFRDETLVPYR